MRDLILDVISDYEAAIAYGSNQCKWYNLNQKHDQR